MERIKALSIREEQEIHMQILHLFDRICKEESLRYFLAYGTLLGAVREQGFIEWDDDIDIWMPREDYEKFGEVFGRYSSKQYFLQNSKTDIKSVSPEMTRICVNGTYKWQEGCEKEKFHTGIFFDIYPLDYGFGTEQDKTDLALCTHYHKMLTRTVSTKRKHTVRGTIYYFTNRLISRKRYIKKMISLMNSHRECKSDILLSFPASYAGESRSYFHSSFFEETIRIPFEDMEAPVPKRYDELLRYMYGDDYMTPLATKPHRNIAYLISTE